MVPVALYIGDPHPDQHPLNFQNNWLSSVKGGQIPSDIMDSIAKIRDLAIKNNIVFEDLCYYAINVANGSLENNNEKFGEVLKLLQ